MVLISLLKSPIIANLGSGGDIARQALRAASVHVRQKYSFIIDAFVLLPDHFHCLWTLPGTVRSLDIIGCINEVTHQPNPKQP